jgi:hypothetical protein
MTSGEFVAWVVSVTVAVVVVLGAAFGLFFGMNAFGRYQDVANAQNQVQVNAIVIAQTDQLVQVEKQKAQVRIADANGIASAQSIIAGSLTPAYLEYLAIQAQNEMAAKSDHSATIYIPVGNQGIPIVATQPVKP